MPERFWGKMDSEAARQVDSVFGFGRRVCPGRTFAESSIYLLISNIIATMDLSKATDETGAPITPSVEYTKSFIR
jgi:cytochrome P450